MSPHRKPDPKRNEVTSLRSSGARVVSVVRFLNKQVHRVIRQSNTRVCRTLLLGISLLVFAANSSAQTDALEEKSVPIKPVTREEIDAARNLVDSSESLDDAAKTSANQALDQATVDLQSANSALADTAKMQKAIDEIETLRDSIRKKLETPSEPEEAINPRQPLPVLQQSLITNRTKLTDAEKTLADATAESSRRQTRLLAIPDEREAADKKLQEVKEKLAISPPEGKSSPTYIASKLRLRAAETLMNTTLERLSTEQAYYVTTNEILPLQRQLAEQRVNSYRRIVEELNVAIGNYRRDELSQLRNEVESSIDSSPGAQEVLELLDQYERISSRMTTVTKTRQSVNKQLEEVRTREQTMADRVEAVGLTEALALLLQNEKSRLQNIRRLFQPDANVRSEIRDLQILTFKLEDQANELENPAEPASVQPAPDKLTNGNSQIAISRQQVLQKAAPAGSALFQELVSLDTSQRQLREAIDRYLIYIEEKLLWTRSAPFITASRPADAAKGIGWLLSIDRWLAVPQEWFNDFRESPLRCSAFAILVIALFVGSSRWRHAISAETVLASKRNCVDISPTLRATAATILTAAPIPLALLGIGWVGSTSNSSDQFLSSLGRGFIVTAGLLAPVLLLRQVCRVNGLGEGHFGWSSGMCEKTRRACDTAALFGAPLVLCASTLRSQSDETITNSLGRYLVLIFLGLMLFVLHRLLLPSRFWSTYGNASAFWYRLRRLIYAIAIAIPIGLAILVCSGYSYISHAIASRLLYTAAIFLAVVLVESIALRAIVLRRRKLSIQQLQQQRQQLAEKPADGESALTIATDATTEIDLNSVSLQTRQMIRLVAMSVGFVVFWIIWSDLLPALAMLDRATLWVAGQGTDVSRVSLRDLLFAVLAIGLTVFAVKNLPAVIELLLLQKLPINPGARYAVSTIFRYILGTVGLLIGLSFLSIPWSQLSWIVAAASVGLGFGLQEIVANFVSGIILLLEQPIRVGDVVTVDGTTGVVTKMQIRATTVTNWDRQELVVPNKDLITGKLLNWTLSNVVNRVVIEVGVAYGTDVKKAHQLIMDAANSVPEVMAEPSTVVTLEQFGDNSLNFVVRCYLPSLDKRLQTIHEIHSAIVESLESAGIAIPFPQRDMHVHLAGKAIGIEDIANAMHDKPPSGGGKGD